MAIITVGFFKYDTDDIVGVCDACASDLYNAPILARDIEMTAIQRQGFDVGLWGVGFCPACYEVQIWYST